jgi:hypothetical protein
MSLLLDYDDDGKLCVRDGGKLIPVEKSPKLSGTPILDKESKELIDQWHEWFTDPRNERPLDRHFSRRRADFIAHMLGSNPDYRMTVFEKLILRPAFLERELRTREATARAVSPLSNSNRSTGKKKRGRNSVIQRDRELLNEFESSGLTQAEFARRKKMGPSTLSRALERAKQHKAQKR